MKKPKNNEDSKDPLTFRKAHQDTSLTANLNLQIISDSSQKKVVKDLKRYTSDQDMQSKYKKLIFKLSYE